MRSTRPDSFRLRTARVSRRDAVLALTALLLGWLPLVSADDYQPRNTQAPGEAPPSPIEALYQMTLPEGFEATLFAHEPAIRQPIAMTWDDRGRLWVVESYSYEEWEGRGEDRILIFEDTDGDGRHDKRTLFWDEGRHFAGIALGFGGVWVADAPNLIFIPDRDRDDRPDGPPEVMLDGWTTEAEHNMVNGLQWGPDGWLYGRHGVLAWSAVGRPGTDESARVDVSCGIWRFHPQTLAFEPVSRGSTNPWGLDWDAEGEMFMSGNVNGHLWHVIPGSYLERMHPTTTTPYVYERLTMSADRPHYLGTANWRRDWNRGALGRDGESQLGGGHSHCGAMIYLGDQWPDRYRNLMFMCNTHGRRVNIDRLQASGGSFVGTYEGDFLRAHQPWFRGVTLTYGPEGAVYLSDWTDFGECHDHDGVHRTSGRLFRISHGQAAAWQGDLAQERDDILLGLLTHRNHWFSRHSRRILQERGASGALAENTFAQLRHALLQGATQRQRLEALWALHAIGGLNAATLDRASRDPAPPIRAWAVRLSADHQAPAPGLVNRWLEMAREEADPRVRLYLASAAQRISRDQRGPLLAALAARSEDHADTVTQRMLWYATEPVIAHTPTVALPLAQRGSLRLATLIGRRLMEPDLESKNAQRTLLSLLRSPMEPSRLQALLEGVLTTLESHRPEALDASWGDVLQQLLERDEPTMQPTVLRLAVSLRHAPTLSRLHHSVRETTHPLTQREAELRTLLLVEDDPEVDRLCATLLQQGPAELRQCILPQLPKRKVPQWSDWLLQHWETLDAPTKRLAIDALASLLPTAKQLVQALIDGTVSRQEITATQAQHLAAMRDPWITEQLAQRWGQIQKSSREKEQAMERYRALVTQTQQTPDLQRGQRLYQQSCGACHRLFEEGAQLGPDLTGSDRGNLEYLLRNIIDPSASVAADYRLTVATTKTGRVVSGALVESTPSGVVLRTLTGEERLLKSEVAHRRTLKSSLMPEGLLQSLSDEAVVDLIAYLRTRVATP